MPRRLPASRASGVDDAHFYRMDNIEKAAHGIPHDAFSILLSHTPEIYRQAAHADFNVLMSGHTHGGQMCLPGGIPVTLNCVLQRATGNGSFKHHDMIGYTSAAPASASCQPASTARRRSRCIICIGRANKADRARAICRGAATE